MKTQLISLLHSTFQGSLISIGWVAKLSLNEDNVQFFLEIIGEINEISAVIDGWQETSFVHWTVTFTWNGAKWKKISTKQWTLPMYHNIIYILLYFHPGTHFSFMTTQAHQRVLSFNWILYRIYSLDENFHIDIMKCKVPKWATFVEGSDGLSMFWNFKRKYSPSYID